MPTHSRKMSGKDIFYTKLAVYLHIFKHKSQENLTTIFGVSRSTMRGWVMEFNRSRLESILKNFQVIGGEGAEALEAGGDTLEEIRQLLLKQARNGSIAAAKIILELEREEEAINPARRAGRATQPGITTEEAIDLLGQWDGPRQCSQCGHVDEFKYEAKNYLGAVGYGDPTAQERSGSGPEGGLRSMTPTTE